MTISWRAHRVRVVCFLLCGGLSFSQATGATGDSFSFVVLADPHVYGDLRSPSSQRLQQCVEWVNRNRQAYGIELTFVVGDIGFGGNGAHVQTAKTILDGLTVPYAPIIGDNDILTPEDEVHFANTFEPVYQSLAANPQFSNWSRGPVRVWDPDVGVYDYLQNFAFEYRGVHFVCPDWCDRETITWPGHDPIRREDAELHDFPGGTWPWFTDYITHCSKTKFENIVMLAHHPMHTYKGALAPLASYGAFALAEFVQIRSFLNDPNHDYRPYVALAYAGHYHSDVYFPADMDPNRITINGEPFDPNVIDPNCLVRLPGYDLYITDAVWDDEVRLYLVQVTEQADGFSYVSTSLLVPEPAVAWFLLFGEAVRRAVRRAPRVGRSVVHPPAKIATRASTVNETPR